MTSSQTAKLTGWYRRRREDTWDQRDEIHHPPLRWGGPSIEHPFTLADEAEMQALPG